MKQSEIWKEIDGYGGAYKISSHGRIISKHRKWKLLTPKFAKNGYLRIGLSMNGKVKMHLVHRLVAVAFIETSDKSLQINHINGIKTDNRVENLEWCTGSDNMKHAYLTGLQKPTSNGLEKRISIQNGSKKKTYNSIRDMCREEKLDRRTVQRVLNGERKTYKGLKFSYE